MGRKLILSNIHLGQLLLKCYFLQLDRLIWKLQTFHNLLDIHLAVLSHIDHPIEQGIDSLLIVLQNIGDLDHIAAVVIEWVVKYEFQEVDELGVAFRLFEFAGLEGDVHQFGDVVPSVYFGAEFVCVLVNTLLEVIEFFGYRLSNVGDKMSHIFMMLFDFMEGCVSVSLVDIAGVVVDKFVNADYLVMLGIRVLTLWMFTKQMEQASGSFRHSGSRQTRLRGY